VKYSLCLFCLLVPALTFSQSLSEEGKFLSKLKRTDNPPDGLLSSRAAVLFSSDYSQKELERIQNAFQQIGIDAVVYVESERVLAGADLQTAYSRQFVRRDIKVVIFAQKEKSEYQFSFMNFKPKSIWTRSGQLSWYLHASGLQELLYTVFRALVSTQKRQSFLINDFPEPDAAVFSLADNRIENTMPNIRTAKLAIPKMGDEASSAEQEQYLKDNFHIKYDIVEDTLSEKDLDERGYNYVLRFIHARGSLAKEILGYDRSKSETALVTVTYLNGTLQLKTIPSEMPVYKFYLKNLEDGNLYLGSKWDADLTWQEALKNHLDGYRAVGKIN
jgi:hypothetical protein